ncbi:MAG TPA: LysR family transcriptional regulator [Solirubrobacter sp.]|nr:LysR family transcriptional regulator [Solirubrobacter sp.]
MTLTPDLNELRALCVAADLGTVGRAAVRLHVSQPSLSKRLAALEAKVGLPLLERSPRGVTLTAAGRKLYRHARPLLEAADEVGEVMAGIRETAEIVRLASSHSATEAFTAAMLARRAPHAAPVELVTANSQVVRGMVADGRADVGVAAARPRRTPYPGVRESALVDDAVVCAVPPEHPWAARGRVGRQRFLATPMVVRDPSSNARWTVDTVLGEAGLKAAAPLAEAATPRAALSEAREHNAPVLLSRHIIAQTDFIPAEIEGLSFPRDYVLITPAYGEPTGEVRALCDAIRDYIRIWLR